MYVCVCVCVCVCVYIYIYIYTKTNKQFPFTKKFVTPSLWKTEQISHSHLIDPNEVKT